MKIIENKSNMMIFGEDDFIKLVSYKSYIAKYNTTTKKLELFKDWEYSTTTKKHLSYFLSNYTCLTFDEVKKMVKRGGVIIHE